MATQSYTKRTNRPNQKPPKNQIDRFYAGLHDRLKALQKIQKQLPPETWARFIAAYSQHWLYSIKHGEKAAAPGHYYAEWAEAQHLGTIPMDTDTTALHAARHYQVYESPRARARKVLGLEVV